MSGSLSSIIKRYKENVNNLGENPPDKFIDFLHIIQKYSLTSGHKSDILKFLTELVFGDFASRNGLTRKMREMLTLVLLASMGDTELQLKSHFAGALKTGNTKEELVAALVHASAYMGIPRLFNTLNACKDIISE